MNKIEQLQKLIALANNNPNEHEANSAARKVCKLIVELKINFVNRSQPQQQQQRPNPYTYPNPYSAPPKPQEPPPRPDKDWEYWDQIFKDARRQAEEEKRKNKEKYERDQQNYNHKNQNYNYKDRPPKEVKIPTGFDWSSIPLDFKEADYKSIFEDIPFADFKKRYTDPFTKPKEEPKKKEKKLRTCAECKQEFMTGYIGNLFICHGCHWKEYERSKKTGEQKMEGEELPKSKV